jgi:dienelactone hydrolase
MPSGEQQARGQRRGALTAVAVAAAAALLVVVVALASDGGASGRRTTPAKPTTAAAPAAPGRTAPAPAPVSTTPPPPRRFAVGLVTLRLVDRSRTVRFPGHGAQPRPLVTYVRYPALGTPRPADRAGARPDRAHGPYPLVVFGHGFALTPALYAPLLRAWTRAGYVVAAPVFPLENANAPGGPNENDLVNQPRDVSFVISQVVAASRAGRGALGGLVDGRRIAATGHSDGGETALAIGYDPAFRDRRVGTVVILSGARIPGRGVRAGPGSPALLATQGTADPINPPSATYDFFAAVGRPKFLLKLYGAGHEGPYSTGQPQLGIVQRVTTAFLDRYVKRLAVSVARLRAVGAIRGVSSLVAAP